MGAIRAHKTATDTESAWDGSGEVAKADNDAAELRYMHAWVNDDGDPAAKSSYKFPHHNAGTDTPANIAGVNNALARLSQADIPDGDRAGVEGHLNAHRRDAGLEDELEDAKTPGFRVVAPQGRDDASRKREPVRCFDGNTKPHEAFWKWRDAVDEGGEPEMELYGYISEYSWWNDDITPKIFKDQLYKNGKGGPITIRMNSGGGDVTAASVMRAILMDYPGRVTVQIDGLAASAATVVAIAGNVVKMMDTAYFMIHDPIAVFFLAALNIEELSRLTDSLKSVKEGIINAYEGRTGMSRDRLARMMSKETWMSAQEAVDMGFVDEILSIKKEEKTRDPLPENAAIVNALRHYVNVPEALLAQGRQSEPVKAAESPEAATLRAKAKILSGVKR